VTMTRCMTKEINSLNAGVCSDSITLDVDLPYRSSLCYH